MEIPSGFTELTKDAFYKTLEMDQRDIMPSVQSPNYTTWETKSRQVWGWSYPGWKNPGEPSKYAVKNHD